MSEKNCAMLLHSLFTLKSNKCIFYLLVKILGMSSRSAEIYIVILVQCLQEYRHSSALQVSESRSIYFGNWSDFHHCYYSDSLLESLLKVND